MFPGPKTAPEIVVSSTLMTLSVSFALVVLCDYDVFYDVFNSVNWLVVTCDQYAAPSDLRYTLLYGHDRIKHWPRPSVCLSYTRQLEIPADHKYFLPFSVRYSVIADGRGSYRLSRQHTFFFGVRY